MMAQAEAVADLIEAGSESAARSALPNIDGLLRQPPYEPPINATQEQLDAQMKDGDYRRCLRDAKARISR